MRLYGNIEGCPPKACPLVNLTECCVSTRYHNEDLYAAMLDITSTATTCIPTISVTNNCEDTMYHNDPTINYLTNRTAGVYADKLSEASVAYGVDDGPFPGNVKEAVERIQAGKFMLSKEKEDYAPYDLMHSIRWRDPAIKEDQEGYDAFYAKLEKAKTETRDTIMVMGAEKGLEALKAFESLAVH